MLAQSNNAVDASLEQNIAAKLNYELFDQAVGAFDWSCIEELRKGVAAQQEMQQAATAKIATPTPAAVAGTARRATARATGAAAGLEIDPESRTKLQTLRADLDKPFASGLLLWQKIQRRPGQRDGQHDPSARLGKYFHPADHQPDRHAGDRRADDDRRQSVRRRSRRDPKSVASRWPKCSARCLAPSASTPDQIVGKGYLEITIDRQKAARYGINVGDVQDVIEVALGGKPITSTVEGRERYPVRIRYARDFRSDEEQIKNLLINAAGAGGMPETSASDVGGQAIATGRRRPRHPSRARPLQIPLASVADVRIVEGPSEIKSENGMLRAYVQFNVNTPDVVGFVEQAKRRVAQKVTVAARACIWNGAANSKTSSPPIAPCGSDPAAGAGLDFCDPLSDLQRFHGRRADDDGGAGGLGRRRVFSLAHGPQL